MDSYPRYCETIDWEMTNCQKIPGSWSQESCTGRGGVILRSSGQMTPVIMVLPVVVFFFVMIAFPLLYSITLSFHKWSLISGAPRFIWFDNYLSLIQDDRFLMALWTTLIFTAGVTSIEFLIGLGLALSLRIRGKTAAFLRSILIMPMMLTPVAVGLMWRYLYDNSSGVFVYFLSLLGVQNMPAWLGDASYALPAVMAVDIWQWTPFIFLILLSGISSLPPTPFEAAKVDGASTIQMFRYITFPLLMPFIIIAVTLRLVTAFKVFDIVYVLTRGGPADKTQTLSMYIYKNGWLFLKMGYASALSYVMLIIIVLISVFFLYLQKPKE